MLKSVSVKPVTYVGYTNNLKKRLDLHNSNKGAKFTRGKKWKLVYYKKYDSRSMAMKKEYILTIPNNPKEDISKILKKITCKLMK